MARINRTSDEGRRLTVGQHHDEGHVEDVGQPSGQLKWNRVADVHDVAAGAAPGVDEEGLPFLVPVEDQLEVAVREDDAPAEEAVRLVARDALEPLEQGVVDELGAELLYELVVVDGLDHAVLADLARDAPRVDVLLPRHRRGGLGGGREGLGRVMG